MDVGRVDRARNVALGRNRVEVTAEQDERPIGAHFGGGGQAAIA